MRARRVTSPDGRRWRVGRRWLPWRVRLRREEGDSIQLLDLADAGSLVATLVLIVGAFLLLFVVWPVVALALELLIAVLVALGGLIVRVVFRRPWRIEASPEGAREPELAWEVVGWSASATAIDEVCSALERGRTEVLPAHAA